MKTEKKDLEYYLIAIVFGVLIIVCFLQVLFRMVLNLPLAWTEELSRYTFILLVYLGASSAAKKGSHVRVELIDNFLPEKIRRWFSVVVQILCAAISMVITVNLKDLIVNALRANQLSAALRMPMAAMYIMVACMFTLIAVRFLQRAWYIAKEGTGEKA